MCGGRLFHNYRHTVFCILVVLGDGTYAGRTILVSFKCSCFFHIDGRQQSYSHTAKAVRRKKLQPCWERLVKIAFVVILGVFLFVGIGNYRNYSELVWEQSQKTDATLAIIGEPDKDVKLVTNGVKHLGWTVLNFYFPDNEVVNGSYTQVDCDEYWFFNTVEVMEDVFYDWKQRGYKVTDYREMQLSQYPFALYHLEKIKE